MASWYAVCNVRRDPHERSQDPQKPLAIYYAIVLLVLMAGIVR